MKPLETEFNYQGRTLRQLKRRGRVAIYELIGGHKLTYGYEVIVIQIVPEKEMFGKVIAEHEAYPGSNDWGKKAWSFGRNQRDDAFLAFERLAASKNQAEESGHGLCTSDSNVPGRS
jgi:hypothetical protein